MPKKSEARESMISAARRLMEAQGVSAMGLMSVVAAAEAPRGSIYHHFPGGKDELVIAAIEQTASQAEALILRAGHKGGAPADVVRRIAAIFRFAPEAAKWQAGCPVAATAVEGHSQTLKVRKAVAAAFTRWSAATAAVLIGAGIEQEKARQLGLGIISSLEGGLILARGLQCAAPYDATVEMIIAALDKV